jgi:spectinomycin phosphotransferase
MRGRPPGLSDDQVTQILAGHWHIMAADLSYVPWGAGSYHWSVTDQW